MQVVALHANGAVVNCYCNWVRKLYEAKTEFLAVNGGHIALTGQASTDAWGS